MGMPIRRILPHVDGRHVGPWVFLDHFGPQILPPGSGLDVGAHPHVHLATVTYLLEGAILHRDSLGTEQVIRPGAINWMTAGHGIVHSERSPPEERDASSALHGLQLWLALPDGQEDVQPSFHHHPAHTLPEHRTDGVTVRVLVGEAFGHRSPVHTLSPTLYLDVAMETGTHLTLPPLAPEQAVYLLDGHLTVGDPSFEQPILVFAQPDVPLTLRARAPTRLVVLGGQPVGPRFMSWNFVGSTQERVTRARQRWSDDAFPPVPGETERIPLPPRHPKT